VAALVPSPDAVVLDYGCGEALSAEHVAARCTRLYLCDAAPLVRERLVRRFGGSQRIAVLAPEEVGELPDASIDLVVANSLVQYLSHDELRDCLLLWRTKLKRSGQLVLADVVPPDVSPLADAAALLSFARRGGFLKDAVIGLARTSLSEYRRLRRDLGLARYTEGEMIAILCEGGFTARRRWPNLGHNQARMTFVAQAP
jgi:SAM-dependent methyltransferase